MQPGPDALQPVRVRRCELGPPLLAHGAAADVVTGRGEGPVRAEGHEEPASACRAVEFVLLVAHAFQLPRPHGNALEGEDRAKGLKAGIYLPAGLEKEAYGAGQVPIWNADGCTTADIVYGDLRTTNGWDSSYKLDFSQPCTQKYTDSQAQLLAGWGYDFLKLDGVGVGPGSGKSGDQYDNVADVAAWNKAIAGTGRPIHLQLSWSLRSR